MKIEMIIKPNKQTNQQQYKSHGNHMKYTRHVMLNPHSRHKHYLAIKDDHAYICLFRTCRSNHCTSRNSPEGGMIWAWMPSFGEWHMTLSHFVCVSCKMEIVFKYNWPAIIIHRLHVQTQKWPQSSSKFVLSSPSLHLKAGRTSKQKQKQNTHSRAT